MNIFLSALLMVISLYQAWIGNVDWAAFGLATCYFFYFSHRLDELEKRIKRK